MRKNVSGQSISGRLISKTDGSDVTTGTASVFVTIDNGSQSAGGGTVTHKGNGEWSYAPTQAETNGNHIAFSFVHTSSVGVTVNAYPVAFDPSNATSMGLGNLDVAVTSRAPAATALLNTTWTDARAAFVDAAISSRSVSGDAMTLTTGERTAIANEVESQIIDETDSEKVLLAITNKIAAANPDLSGLTLGAIASASAAATSTALDTRFDDIDAAIGSIGGGSTPPTPEAIAAEVDSTIAPRFAGLSTYAGGPVESVGLPVTVGTVQDKTGYKLSPDGLDSISTSLAAVPTNFREWIMLGIHRLIGKSEKEKLSESEAVIRVFGSDPATVVTEQTVTTTSTKIQIGPPSAP